jgi:hypothetical protein
MTSLLIATVIWGNALGAALQAVWTALLIVCGD